MVALAATLAVAAIVVGITTSNAAVAGALAVLAPVAVITYQSVQTRRAVDTGHEDVEASRQLAREAREDRKLAVRPFVALGDCGATYELGGTPTVQLRNIGAGPAIRVRVVQWCSDAVHWSAEGLLAAGEMVPPAVFNDLGTELLPLIRLDSQQAHQLVDEAIVSPKDKQDLAAYCLDQLGNPLRFNLRTGEPPHGSDAPGADVWMQVFRW